MPLRIGITLGDPAGIGPEIVHAAIASGKLPEADYQIIGDAANIVAGKPGDQSARAAWHAMEEAARRANSGDLQAVVTGPIHKANMAKIGFEYPGQTEFFAARSGTTNYAMLLTAGAITVALVTTHIPLREVPGALRKDEIVRVGKLLTAFMHQRGLIAPRLVVAGLNPHAGECGRMGREELETVEPAVEQLIRESESATFEGPISPDTLFHHLAQGKWDAALCLYHDQGLIPLKLHGFDQGVNVTLGLPYPRTSPDHGTAFDIAGKNLARPESLIAAITLAVDLAKS